MGPHPRDQLVEGEGLGHVVGRAGLEARDLLGGLIECRQEDHRQGRLRASDRRQDLEPVAAREHPIEHDEVEPLLEGEPLALDAIGGGPHREPLGGEPTLEEVGDSRLVLDHQDLHVAMN